MYVTSAPLLELHYGKAGVIEMIFSLSTAGAIAGITGRIRQYKKFFISMSVAGVLISVFIYRCYFINTIKVWNWLLYAYSITAVFAAGKFAAGISVSSDPDKYFIIRSLEKLIPHLTAAGITLLLLMIAGFPQLSPDQTGFFISGAMWSAALGGVFYALFIFSFSDIEIFEHMELAHTHSGIRKTTLQLVEKISDAVLASHELDAVYAVITDTACKAGDARASALYMRDPEKKTFACVSVSGVYPPVRTTLIKAVNARQITEMARNEEFAVNDGTWVGLVAGSGENLIRNNNSELSESADSENMSLISIDSLLAVPVLESDEVIGVLALINKDDTQPWFDSGDVILTGTLARQAALARRHHELYRTNVLRKIEQRDLSIAADFQKMLFPDPNYQSNNIEIYAITRAAMVVSGDYYDYVQLSAGHYGMIVCDVAGKGIPASLIMVILSVIFKNSVKDKHDSAEILTRLDKAVFSHTETGAYATGLYCIYDASEKKLIVSGSACLPLMLYREKTGVFCFSTVKGYPLGLLENSAYSTEIIAAEPGDLLFMYTDGITEAMNAQREQYGIERMKKVIKDCCRESCEEISRAITADIEKFTSDEPQHDDMTLLSIRLK